MKLTFVPILLVSSFLAGCTADSNAPSTFTTLVASFHNTGASDKQVELTVTGPDNSTLLHRSFRVPHGVHNETVAAAKSGRYVLYAKYDETSVQGTSTQTITGGQRHVLRAGDCTSPTVVVVFTFSYTRSAGSQKWSHQGSAGHCEGAWI